MTLIIGHIDSYHAGSTGFSFVTNGVTYGVALNDAAFSPPAATPKVYYSAIVQCDVVLKAHHAKAPVQFEIDMAATDQTLQVLPPGSHAGDPLVIVKRVFNLQNT